TLRVHQRLVLRRGLPGGRCRIASTSSGVNTRVRPTIAPSPRDPGLDLGAMPHLVGCTSERVGQTDDESLFAWASALEYPAMDGARLRIELTREPRLIPRRSHPVHLADKPTYELVSTCWHFHFLNVPKSSVSVRKKLDGIAK
ncbi:MAG: hypothetical protein KGL39_53430, partial [Patescibacteria group bacterium]|nr:hypothetical protein [Patescibacteria group bacterium]